MKLHEKIIVYRKKCGLSQETLAEKIGVSRQAVSKWETGDALPEITKLKSLADCFGVTVDFLLDDNADEFQTPKNDIQKTGLDRVIDGVGDLFERFVLYLKKHSWIVGVVVILFGISIVLRGFITLVPAMSVPSHIFSAIGIPFLIIPITYVIVGVLIIIGGIIIIKKTKKK